MMIQRLLRRCWINLLIAFDENFTLEGFEKTQQKFGLPENFSLVDRYVKRKLTICNLFANHNQSIRNIARLLEVHLGTVVSVLIENGLIKERRSSAKRIRQEKRQKSQAAPQAWPESVLRKPGGREIAIAAVKRGMTLEGLASKGKITDWPVRKKAKSA